MAFNAADFVNIISGNIPVIISAPHGGLLAPSEIPDRSVGCLVTDSVSDELARAISASLFRRTGKQAALVLLKIVRAKLDANRPKSEATQDHPLSGQVYDVYHGGIQAAIDAAVDTFGFAHIFDIHGQSHRPDGTELGYLLNQDALAKSDDEMNQSNTWSQSSLSAMQTICKDRGLVFSEILRGERSIGYFVGRHGYLGVPGPAMPSVLPSSAVGKTPQRLPWVAERCGCAVEQSGEIDRDQFPLATNRNTYYSGGFITRKYTIGSDTVKPYRANCVSATQLETPIGVRIDDTERERFADAVSDAIVQFFAINYGVDLAAL